MKKPETEKSEKPGTGEVPRGRPMAPWDKRLGGTGRPPDDLAATARALWEGVPNASCASVAAEMDVPEYAVQRWKREGGWVKTHQRMPGMSARAHAVADSYTEKVAEAVGATGEPANAPVTIEVAQQSVADGFAVDVRGQLLNRHRQEWSAPRKLAYDAIKAAGTPGSDPVAAFEKAKLAKITAETLTLIQSGELRAYGMKPGDIDAGMVVIERGDGGGE